MFHIYMWVTLMQNVTISTPDRWAKTEDHQTTGCDENIQTRGPGFKRSQYHTLQGTTFWNVQKYSVQIILCQLDEGIMSSLYNMSQSLHPHEHNPDVLKRQKSACKTLHKTGVRKISYNTLDISHHSYYNIPYPPTQHKQLFHSTALFNQCQ